MPADRTDRPEAEGARCLAIAGDVKDPQFCRQAVQRTLDTFGRLDILVNNAAFQMHASSLDDITDERLDETVRTNVHGYFHMARAALPHVRRCVASGSVRSRSATWRTSLNVTRSVLVRSARLSALL